jgi:hypothetical protein
MKLTLAYVYSKESGGNVGNRVEVRTGGIIGVGVGQAFCFKIMLAAVVRILVRRLSSLLMPISCFCLFSSETATLLDLFSYYCARKSSAVSDATTPRYHGQYKLWIYRHAYLPSIAGSSYSYLLLSQTMHKI